MSAATRSEPECNASEMTAIDPERMPTTSLKAMSTEFEAMETAAARDFWRLSVRGSRVGASSGVDKQTFPPQPLEERGAGQGPMAGAVLERLGPLGHRELRAVGHEHRVV